MSKEDMLGPLPRALVRLDKKHQGLVLDVLNKLSGKADEAVHARIAKALREEKEEWKPIPPQRICPDVNICYPLWFRELAAPELEHIGPYDYLSNQIERFDHYLTDGNKPTTGHYIYERLKRNHVLGRCLGLADAQAIAGLGTSFLRRWCGRSELYFWRSVVRDEKGTCHVPYLSSEASTVLNWQALDESFEGNKASVQFVRTKEV